MRGLLLLAELALRRGLRVLAGLSAAARQLPRIRARQVAELPDQEHVLGVDERDDADGGADVEHGIAALVASGQPPEILAKRQLAEALEGRRAEEMPLRIHGRFSLGRPAPREGLHLCYRTGHAFRRAR